MIESFQDRIQLVCPDCGSPLLVHEKKLNCGGCDKVWPIEDNIPRFRDDHLYWGEIPRELMSEVLLNAKSKGWRSAIEFCLQPEHSKLIDYIANEIRADWRYLIPLEKNHSVLDIGAGWGAISAVLSRHSNLVVALERIRQRVEFLKLRYHQDKIDNVQILQTDFSLLPFEENTFDVIVCNGVLEWVGLYDDSKTPEETQVMFLNKLATILKPGGYLYIGIENRFSYKQILGSRDHSGLRFTSLVPRKMANWMTALFPRKGGFYLEGSDVTSYRTYTYSLAGYRKLLHRSGFPKADFYYPFSSYNYPRWLIPTDTPRPLSYFMENLLLPRSSLGRFLKRIACIPLPGTPQRLVMPDYCIIAQNSTE